MPVMDVTRAWHGMISNVGFPSAADDVGKTLEQ
jgi:hypothetical protein